MDGVHDLGGREGFGPIVDKADDEVINADWEIRNFAKPVRLRSRMSGREPALAASGALAAAGAGVAVWWWFRHRAA